MAALMHWQIFTTRAFSIFSIQLCIFLDFSYLYHAGRGLAAALLNVDAVFARPVQT
jgi:hypothetical protein